MSGTARCVITDRSLTRSLDSTEEGLAVKATRICSVDGCQETRRWARGFCGKHYMERWKDGTLGDAPRIRVLSDSPTCKIEDCERMVFGRGWCAMHWKRWYKHGDPMVVTRRKPDSEIRSYEVAHQRLQAVRGPARNYACVSCGKPAAHWAYDHDDLNEQVDPKRDCRYSADPAHYQPMCIPCHWTFDEHPLRYRGGRKPRH